MHESNHFNRRIIYIGEDSKKAKTEDGKEGGEEMFLSLFNNKKLDKIALNQAIFLDNLEMYNMHFKDFVKEYLNVESNFEFKIYKERLQEMNVTFDELSNNICLRYDKDNKNEENCIEVGECGCKYLIEY